MTHGLLVPDSAGRLGIPKYVLRNLRADIRRLRTRMATLEREATTAPPLAEKIGEVEIDEADNCVRVFFPARPDDSTRRRLREFGFRRAASVNGWQQHATRNAWERAREIARLLVRTPEEDDDGGGR